jgi:hypothetical protein
MKTTNKKSQAKNLLSFANSAIRIETEEAEERKWPVTCPLKHVEINTPKPDNLARNDILKQGRPPREAVAVISEKVTKRR